MLTKTCPRCEDGTITATTYDEYQGEPPHGGMVTFVDEITADCDCWTDDELGDMDLEGFEDAD